MLRVLAVLLAIGGISGLPVALEDSGLVKVDEPVTLILDLVPPNEDAEESDYARLARAAPDVELVPPKEDAEKTNYGVEDDDKLKTGLLPPVEGSEKRPHVAGVFVVNLFAIKNNTDGDDPSDVLSDDVKDKIPAILEPIATVLLVLEEDDEDTPVSLDELAKDLEEDGFKVDKLGNDGETKIIKVDFDGAPTEVQDIELLPPNKVNKVRRRRSPHLLGKLLNKKYGGGGCNTCGGGYQPPPPPPPCPGGCGGGGYGGGGQVIGVIPVQVVPVQYQPQPQYRPPPPQYHPQPQYQPPPHYHQGGGQCDICSGGGRGGGNHGSYSQSSAQASAQSSSGNW